MLHVSSTDPRRRGSQDLAIFERDLVPLIEMYKWKYAHERIENEFGKSILSIITGVRKTGTVQIEPNCDYTLNNLCRRAAPVYDGTKVLLAYKEAHPTWREDMYEARVGKGFFAPIRYRKRSEWVEVTVDLLDGGTVTIKVNTFMLRFIPKVLVFRPNKPTNQLFLLPNKEQRKRKKYTTDTDKRHGQALTEYILEQIGTLNSRRVRLSDRFDYRVDDSGDFVARVAPHNDWISTPLGTLLKITIPANYSTRVFDFPPEHIYPHKDVISAGEEYVGYFLMQDNVAEYARDYVWSLTNTYSTKSATPYASMFEFGGVKYPQYYLKKLVCELNGNATSNVLIPSRMSKYYERAVAADNYASRARFENAIPLEQSTGNRMFVQAKLLKHRHIHADKTVSVTYNNQPIIAQDLRMESVRIGGATKQLSQE